MSQFRSLRQEHPAACTGICLLALHFVFCLPAWAQLAAGGPVPATSTTPATPATAATAQPEVTQDALGRTTPRGTVLGFLTAARKGQNELAAQYLNTPLRGKAAITLSQQLFAVLDRHLPARLTFLSNKPEGSRSNPLRPDEDRVGAISTETGMVDIIVERVDRGNTAPIWLFSSNTLHAIPDLYQESNLTSVDDVLPAFLVETRIAGIPLFHFAALVGMPLVYYGLTVLDRCLGLLVGLLRRRLYSKPPSPPPSVLPPPIRLLLLAFFIRWAVSTISLPLFARQLWTSAATLITVAASVWLLLLFDSWAEHRLQQLLSRRNIAGVTGLLRLGRRALDLLAIIGGALLTFYFLGATPTALLAGFGVGGIAIALAAQKTLENVIGGVSLILDRVVNLGDFIRVGGVEGTVEGMSLRSTRIRTFDRTVISLPNGQVANMTLENVSTRDKFWLHSILPLSPESTSQQMHTALERVRGVLEESHDVERSTGYVRFRRVARTALDIEVFAYVLARNWLHFLELQEGILLRITERLEAAGIQIARPLRIGVVDAPASNDAAGPAPATLSARTTTLVGEASASGNAPLHRSSP